MRYQNPSIPQALANIRRMGIEQLRIIPLFPQYASATTGSVIEKIMNIIQEWPTYPELSVVVDFYDNQRMIEAFADNAQQYNLGAYDHFLFSYHGLPMRQLRRVTPSEDHDCEKAQCRHQITDENRRCYLAQCYATTRMLAQRLDISPANYTVCFQSRLGKTPWIQPYTSDVLTTLAGQQKKRLLVFSPAFVADCLETIYEVGTEYAEDFKALGGEEVQLVESLNGHPAWITALKELATAGMNQDIKNGS